MSRNIIHSISLQRMSPTATTCISYINSNLITIKYIHILCCSLSNDSCRDSHLRDQLKSYGVPLRNGKGEAIVRNDRSTQSMGSPSTLGVRTPTSTDIPPASPRPNSTDRVVHSISNAPSRLPTPIRRPSALHASSGHSSPSNTTAATQRPIQQRLPHTTNYYSESRINSPSNINPSQHQTLQNSKHAAI